MAAQAAMAAIAVISAAQQAKANNAQIKATQDQAAEAARRDQLQRSFKEKQQRAQLKAELAARRARQGAGGVGGAGGSSAAVLKGMQQKADEDLGQSRQISQQSLDALRSSTERNLLGIEDQNKQNLTSMASTVADYVKPGSGAYVSKAGNLL